VDIRKRYKPFKTPPVKPRLKTPAQTREWKMLDQAKQLLETARSPGSRHSM